jgi:hypothetical protein
VKNLFLWNDCWKLFHVLFIWIKIKFSLALYDTLRILYICFIASTHVFMYLSIKLNNAIIVLIFLLYFLLRITSISKIETIWNLWIWNKTISCLRGDAKWMFERFYHHPKFNLYHNSSSYTVKRKLTPLIILFPIIHTSLLSYVCITKAYTWML